MHIRDSQTATQLWHMPRSPEDVRMDQVDPSVALLHVAKKGRFAGRLDPVSNRPKGGSKTKPRTQGRRNQLVMVAPLRVDTCRREAAQGFSGQPWHSPDGQNIASLARGRSPIARYVPPALLRNRFSAGAK